MAQSSLSDSLIFQSLWVETLAANHQMNVWKSPSLLFCSQWDFVSCSPITDGQSVPDCNIAFRHMRAASQSLIKVRCWERSWRTPMVHFSEALGHNISGQIIRIERMQKRRGCLAPFTARALQFNALQLKMAYIESPKTCSISSSHWCHKMVSPKSLWQTIFDLYFCTNI